MASSRLLLLVPSTSYRVEDFLSAARRLEVAVTVGSDHQQMLADAAPGGSLQLRFDDVRRSADTIAEYAQRYPLAGIVGTDDVSLEVAAAAAAALGLAHNSPAAVRAAGDKCRFRELSRQAGLPSPTFRLVHDAAGAQTAARQIGYPCVLKPTRRSGSQGVIRVDGPAQCHRAAERILDLLRPIYPAHDLRRRQLLVESYIAGREYALDALLVHGQLHELALFDKPEPLVGPFFEETLLVAPGRVSPAVKSSLLDTVRRAAQAIGLTHGPIHAELRIPDGSPSASLAARPGAPAAPVLIELAPRTIGGLCSRALRFPDSATLESLVIEAAIGHLPASVPAAVGASGVMMIPIPHGGTLRGVAGLAQARAVPGVCEINMAIAAGESVVALPEGDRYLGFIFARGESADVVEEALRTAHQSLRIDIAPGAATQP